MIDAVHNEKKRTVNKLEENEKKSFGEQPVYGTGVDDEKLTRRVQMSLPAAPVSTPRSWHSDLVPTLTSIGDVTLVLHQLEEYAEHIVDHYFEIGKEHHVNDDWEYLRLIREVVGDMEWESRALRAYLNRIMGDIIIRNTSPDPYTREVDRLGFEGFVGKDDDGVDCIEFAIPYRWITASSAYIYSVKELKKLNNLTYATHVWHWVMEGALKKMEPHVPFTLPLQRAQMNIVVYKPGARLGDPDHFWYRPIVDTFVARQFISHDDARSLHIHVAYERDEEQPEIRIRLRKMPDNIPNLARNATFAKVF